MGLLLRVQCYVQQQQDGRANYWRELRCDFKTFLRCLLSFNRFDFGRIDQTAWSSTSALFRISSATGQPRLEPAFILDAYRTGVGSSTSSASRSHPSRLPSCLSIQTYRQDPQEDPQGLKATGREEVSSHPRICCLQKRPHLMGASVSLQFSLSENATERSSRGVLSLTC